MDSSEGAQRFLKISNHLGLSEYEARVYFCLVTEGASEGRRLSTGCGVPRTKIYSTLKKLMERGLAFELPENPRKFAAASPAEAFGRWLSHFKDETSERIVSLVESREVVSSLQEVYEKRRSNIEPQKEEVWVVQDRSEILRKIKEMLSRAKRNITIITSENGFVFFCRTFDKLLDKAVEKGVKVHIGTPINQYSNSLARELNYICKVEHIDIDSPLFYMCVDDQSSFLAQLNLNNADSKSEKTLGVVCNSSALCSLFSLLIPRLHEKKSVLQVAKYT